MSVNSVFDDVSQVVSVGKALDTRQGLTTNHPLYLTTADAVVDRVNELSARRGVSKASGKFAALTVALESHESRDLTIHFPEFNLVNYGSGRPGHAWWVQFRKLANQWLMLQASHYGNSVAHLGGSVLSYILSDFEDAVMLADVSSAAAVHDRHTDNLDVFRIFQNYAKVSKDLGLPEIRKKYEAYLRREKFRTVTPASGMPKVDVLCVDCSMYAYSPLQVASMMMQAEASLAFGCFVFDPMMLLQEDGEIPGTGVFYQKTSSGLVVQYPEGQAGVLRYPKGVWESWLASQVFPVGRGAGRRWFQLELLQNRNHLMFFRMTALSAAPESMTVHHSLEIAGAADKYLVNAWELNRLGADPVDPRSWVNKPYLVSKRLVDRVYTFAMQLEKINFTRYAIRKQLHIVNDRVTVEGTSVTVNSPLGVKLVDSLVVAIYSRAFVDRYESGQLTQEMMKVVSELAGFSDSNWYVRVWMLMRLCLVTVWDYTLGYVNDAFRRFADWIRTLMSRTAYKLAPDFSITPPYLLLSGSTEEWLTSISQKELVRVAREHVYRASVAHSGFASSWTDAFSRLSASVEDLPLHLQTFRVEYMNLHSATDAVQTKEVAEFVSRVKGLNPIAEELDDRYAAEVATVARQVREEVRVNFDPDPDPVYTLNELYTKVCPAVGLQNLEHDTASVSLDPQDRTLAAPYLKLPTYFGEAPRPRAYYKSRLQALNVPKRQGTLQELLSSMAARNLNAPQVSLPQDEEETIKDVWNVFLSEACVPEARQLLQKFQNDPVELTEQGLKEWAQQATPEKLRMAKAEMEEKSQALAEMSVSDYIAMLKADVKPTLSTKPVESRTEPQVIVYHEKALSALYSSMFRMLVRRFMLLLKPNYHVNLLKDTADIQQFIQQAHPFGSKVSYLENDFSKYDKSQGRFVFKLEEFVFRQLGLNEEMLEKWVDGHVECSIRSVALGLSLHVMYQRKSGDATTAFGNVILNVLSVTYAYRGTQVAWAVFMGDDSLVCANRVGCPDTAVATMAEVFNLGAKTYQTTAPYYASNFVLIDDLNQEVVLLPDPVKRIERWSMSLSADDPQWHERFVSANDTMREYMYGANSAALARAVSLRYQVSFDEVGDIVSPMATLITDESKFRQIWEDRPTVSVY